MRLRRVVSLRLRPRQLWPQRIRTRLTVLFAGLFLLAGSILLGLTYGLVAASLPATKSPPGLTKEQQLKVALSCTRKAGGDLGQAKQCDLRAYAEGVGAGSSDQRDRALHSLLTYSLLGLGVLTCASAGLGWLVSRRVLAPVRTITGTAQRASQEHLGERLSMQGPHDELRELADTFDDMLDRLDRAFTAQRQFVANASHELRTPLTVMRTAIEVTLAKPNVSQQQLVDMVERVRRSIDKAQQMVEALLTLALSDQGPASSELLDLSALAEDALDLARPAIDTTGLRVDTELSTASTRGDAHLVERMVCNLVDNAVRHNVPGGWIRVRTGCGEGTAFLHVVNSGRVIPEAALASLLEPFQRLDGRTGNRDGAGLGLSIAHSVSVAHGATMVISNPAAGGLEVLVRMPEIR
ncbi:MAG: sensor histidine kinase [Streptosporangiaceae bacterium]